MNLKSRSEKKWIKLTNEQKIYCVKKSGISTSYPERYIERSITVWQEDNKRQLFDEIRKIKLDKKID